MRRVCHMHIQWPDSPMRHKPWVAAGVYEYVRTMTLGIVAERMGLLGKRKASVQY